MSRKISLRKSYGYKISSRRLKSSLILLFRRKGFSVFGETDINKSHFLSTNLRDIGVGLSNLRVLTSCQSQYYASIEFLSSFRFVIATSLNEAMKDLSISGKEK
jgi:hypothetical protein